MLREIVIGKENTFSKNIFRNLSIHFFLRLLNISSLHLNTL